MEPKVFPISITQPDFPTLLHVAKVYYGREIARLLDEKRIKLKGPQAYLLCLNNLIRAHSFKPLPSLLRHIHLTVIAEMDMEDLVMITSLSKIDISVGIDTNAIIMSGSLFAWRELCTGVDSGPSTNCRIFSNLIYAIINAFGLAEIWNRHGRVDLKDGTFLLEAK